MRRRVWKPSMLPTVLNDGLPPVRTVAELEVRAAARGMTLGAALRALTGGVGADNFLGAAGLLDLKGGKRELTSDGNAVLADAKALGHIKVTA